MNNLEIGTSRVSSRKQKKPQLSIWTNVCDERFGCWAVNEPIFACAIETSRKYAIRMFALLIRWMEIYHVCMACVYYYDTVCTLCLPLSCVGSTFFFLSSFFRLFAMHRMKNETTDIASIYTLLAVALSQTVFWMRSTAPNNNSSRMLHVLRHTRSHTHAQQCVQVRVRRYIMVTMTTMMMMLQYCGQWTMTTVVCSVIGMTVLLHTQTPYRNRRSIMSAFGEFVIDEHQNLLYARLAQCVRVCVGCACSLWFTFSFRYEYSYKM